MKAHRFLSLAALVLGSFTTLASAQLRVPQQVTAGQKVSIDTGSGGTLYLYGPGSALKQKVQGAFEIPAEQLKAAGRYTVILNGEKANFFVVADKVETVAFLARPSRVPASASGAITGTAFVFDRNNNLVLQPTPVKFDLAVAGAAGTSRTQTSKDGAAWVRMDSGRQQGAAQFVASVGQASTKRIVQQVAADPCNIRMRASKANNGNLLVETDPIRDCSGNAVPDGTIVTFTSVDDKGRSTVDARIKRGVAKAELPASNGAMISVAAGVVMGNEVRWGGK